MPRKTEWIERLPAVLDALADFPALIVDRPSVEILFGVSRRQAIRILHRFGGYQSGRTFLLDRASLVSQLQTLMQDPGVQTEWSRREKLHLRLEQDRRDLLARAIPVKQLARRSYSPISLPSQIQLQPGKLEIEFTETTELLSLLHCLIQNIAENFEEFREATDRDSTQLPVLI